MTTITSTSSSSPSRSRITTHQHRVLIYTTCYNVLDGVTLTIRKLESEILAAGHHVCILTTKSGNPAHTDLVGSHANREVIFMDNSQPIPFLHDPERPELSYQIGFSLSSACRQKLDDFEPSLIHITVPDCTSLHVIQYARQKEIPIMGTFHSNIPEYMEHYPGLSWLKHILAAFFRHQYNFLQALYVPTPYIQRHLMDCYNMDICTSLKVWGRGVDVDRFNPCHRSLKFRRNYNISDDACVVLWVGRLVPEKRPDIFASVIRRLHERGMNYRALVVGTGPCEKEIVGLPNTTFAGWMDGDELATAYASSDVFLFPSAVETFGNVTLEAAASGLPVVVEAGCSGHLVNEGQNGYTVPAGDEESFFESTLALVEDKELREYFRSCSRQLAMSLEKSAVVRQMLDNYTRVTDEFYTEYGGHHCNRDSAYTKPGSFLAGRHPRPLILVFVEHIFIILFKIMWNMTALFGWLLVSLPPRDPRSREPYKSIELTAIESSPPSSPANSSSKSRVSIIPQPENGMNHRTSSFVEMDEVDLAEMGSINRKQIDDDGTGSTSSSQEESSSPSVGSSRTSSSCLAVSHKVAIAFVKAVEFQCRVESIVRNTFRNGSIQPIQGVTAKRKNSSIIFLSSEIKGTRSRYTDSVAVMAPIIDESQTANGSQDSRIMRRNQSMCP